MFIDEFEELEQDDNSASLFGPDEMFIPKGKFEALTRIQTRDLQQLHINSSQGVPLLQLIVSLHKTYKMVRGSLKGAGMGDDASQIKALQEAEKLTAYQIKNQRELGLLIEKEIAKTRMIDSLSGIQNMLILAIQEAAIEFPGNERDNIERLTTIFIEASDRILDQQAEIREWEMDGGSTLLPTSILKERMVNAELARKAELDMDAETKMRDSDLNPFKDVDNSFDSLEL